MRTQIEEKYLTTVSCTLLPKYQNLIETDTYNKNGVSKNAKKSIWISIYKEL